MAVLPGGTSSAPCAQNCCCGTGDQPGAFAFTVACSFSGSFQNLSLPLWSYMWLTAHQAWNFPYLFWVSFFLKISHSCFPLSFGTPGIWMFPLWFPVSKLRLSDFISSWFPVHSFVLQPPHLCRASCLLMPLISILNVLHPIFAFLQSAFKNDYDLCFKFLCLLFPWLGFSSACVCGLFCWFCFSAT